MNKEKLTVQLIIKRLKQHIEKYGMDNGYSTSFSDSAIENNVSRSIDLILPNSIENGDITLRQFRDLGEELYNDIRKICVKNFPGFTDSHTNKKIRIYS